MRADCSAAQFLGELLISARCALHHTQYTAMCALLARERQLKHHRRSLSVSASALLRFLCVSTCVCPCRGFGAGFPFPGCACGAANKAACFIVVYASDLQPQSQSNLACFSFFAAPADSDCFTYFVSMLPRRCGHQSRGNVQDTDAPDLCKCSAPPQGSTREFPDCISD